MRDLSTHIQRAVPRLLARALAAKGMGDGRPFAIGHFITHRCMCSCKSCLWKHNDWPDVPLDLLKLFYEEAGELGLSLVAFTGGEPFLRNDLGQLLAHIKQQGLVTLCFTTGWFLHRRADEVLPHLDMLLLSLDSAHAERHDEIRGLPGLYDRLMDGVSMVRSRYPGLSVQFNCCVQQGIADEIDDILALARQKDVRVSFDVITEYRHGEDGEAFTETDQGMAPDELAAVCQRLIDLKRAGQPIVNSERYFRYFVDGKPGYRCHLPKLVMMVDGRGNVENCLNLNRPIANICDTSLKQIMELPAFSRLRADAEACCSCSSPTMVDLSNVWENPTLILDSDGIAVR